MTKNLIGMWRKIWSWHPKGAWQQVSLKVTRNWILVTSAQGKEVISTKLDYIILTRLIAQEDSIAFSLLKAQIWLEGMYEIFSATYSLHLQHISPEDGGNKLIRILFTSKFPRLYYPEDQHRSIHRCENIRPYRVYWQPLAVCPIKTLKLTVSFVVRMYYLIKSSWQGFPFCLEALFLTFHGSSSSPHSQPASLPASRSFNALIPNISFHRRDMFSPVSTSSRSIPFIYTSCPHFKHTLFFFQFSSLINCPYSLYTFFPLSSAAPLT